MAWLQQILAFGWDCRPLGPPCRLECGLLGALAIEIRKDTPALLAANGMWEPVEDLAPSVREAA
jgi:acyl-homoserine lactone synthase